MSVEQHLLFAVLAFEDELIDLQQLTAACRAWAGDKSKPLADLLVERGWITADHRRFLEEKAERKLARHQNDPRVTLNSVIRGDVCDALLTQVEDSDVRQSLSSWPSLAPVLLGTIGETNDESAQPGSRYTWVSEVGAGGLGKVWLARDNDLSREVALKEIKQGSASSEAVRRLIKEAQITGQLQHPGIVPVYEVSREGRPFYTMKLVRGQTLSQAIREHHEQKQAGKEDPLSERRLLDVFLNVCDAIAYAHSRGVIHRDLKPDNIVLGEFGEAIVLDWGLARQVGSDDEDSAPIVVTGDARTDATQAGQKLGTPAYMAPEQAAGRVEHMDERTDIYGLGAILFEVLTGRPPHQRDTKDRATTGIATLLHRIATGESPQVRSIDGKIPEELAAICATAMAKHRDERYQTTKDLRAALLEFQAHEESIELADRADEDVAAARLSRNYDDFSRARFGFESALRQWPENARAAEGLNETRHEYAQLAFNRGDFDLALSLLDVADPDQVALVTTIQSAAMERTSRTDRIRRLRRFGLATSVMIAVLASVAVVWINSERTKALEAQQDEATQRGIAQQKEREAHEERRAAVIARRIADEERRNAISARKKAEYERQTALVAQRDEARERQRADTAADTAREEKKRADREAAAAKTSADAARLNLKVAEENAGRVRRLLYFSHMNLAQAAWENNQLARTLQLVEQYGAGSESADLRGFECDYWDRRCHDALLTLKGHTGPVNSVAFSPDGQRLASASGDGTVKVWDAATGKKSLTLKGHTGLIQEVSFSPDGHRLATAGAGWVKAWDAATGKELLTLKGHTGGVWSVAFSPNGQRLASASGDGTVKVWDAATGQESLTLEGHTKGVWSVAFSPNGQRLASASGDGTVTVWDVGTGQESLILNGHTHRVMSVAFSPDGERLASAGYDKTVKVWDAATGQESLTLKGHTGPVNCVAFSPDGKRLASASQKGTVKTWDAATGQESLTLNSHTGWVMSVAFHPDGQRLASASVDRTVKVWNVATGQESLTLKGHTGPVFSTVFSPDGRQMASASYDKTVKVWDAASGQESLTLKGHTGLIHEVLFSPDGQRLASASEDGTIKVWDASTGQESLTLKGHALSANTVAFSPDGLRLASADGSPHRVSDPGEVKVWDAATGRESLTLTGHASYVSSVTFSPNGQRLASASFDGTVKVWDASTGQESLTLTGHASSVTSVTFSPDGQRLASASRDGTVKVWDASTGQESLTLKGHTDFVYSVAFSRDGQRLVSASADHTIKVWDARPWTPELRTQSQARELLTMTRDRVKSLEELQADIRSDKTISGMVRKQALDWAELFWKNRKPRQE